MHIFLDTNAILTDPFWRKDVSKLVLNEIKMNTECRLYISEVVVAEVYKNYTISIQAQLKKIDEVKRAYKFLLSDGLKVEIPKPDTELDLLKAFFEKLLKSWNVKRISVSDEVLRSVFNMATAYSYPFFYKINDEDNRNEYKDAVIWESYRLWCLDNNIAEAHFITFNFKDFLSGSDPELTVKRLKELSFYETQKDGVTFKFYKGLPAFLNLHSNKFSTLLQEKPEWLDKLLEQPDFVRRAMASRSYFMLIKSYLQEQYQSEINDRFLREAESALNLPRVSIKLSYVEVNYYDEPKVLPLKNYAIVTQSGMVNFGAAIQMNSYGNENSDTPIGYKNKVESILFSYSFTLMDTGSIGGLQITLDGGESESVPYS
jgi:hypothetical protein